MSLLKSKKSLYISGIGLGVAYGIFTRFFFDDQASLASITFLFFVPIVLGIIPLLFVQNETLKSYKTLILVPAITVVSFFLLMYLSGAEDFLCLMILALPFFGLSMIGAIVFKVIQSSIRKRKGTKLSLIFLPFMLMILENNIKSPSDVYFVKDNVVINAHPDVIWDNIIEVDEIQFEEYETGIFNALGIPRPISATVTEKAVGGQRIGSFDGGLKFIETITNYDEHKYVSFSIKIDTETVGDQVFEQHVLNGDYFTFLEASYSLEILDENHVKLSLSSSYVLTSKVNLYGKFWADLILSDFQTRLLKVIKTRCEKGTFYVPYGPHIN